MSVKLLWYTEFHGSINGQAKARAIRKPLIKIRVHVRPSVSRNLWDSINEKGLKLCSIFSWCVRTFLRFLLAQPSVVYSCGACNWGLTKILVRSSWHIKGDIFYRLKYGQCQVKRRQVRTKDGFSPTLIRATWCSAINPLVHSSIVSYHKCCSSQGYSLAIVTISKPCVSLIPVNNLTRVHASYFPLAHDIQRERGRERRIKTTRSDWKLAGSKPRKGNNSKQVQYPEQICISYGIRRRWLAEILFLDDYCPSIIELLIS